jgi:outer membrane protein assembly factor BamA
MKRHPFASAAVAVAAGLMSALPGLAADARLEYRGLVLPSRQVAALARPALAAPGDSAALGGFLGGLVARLQAQGYLDARATAAWDTVAGRTLRVDLAEGRRYRLDRVGLNTPSSGDSARLARVLGLKPGQPASPAAVREAVERVLGDAVDHGYPYVLLGVSAWETDSSGVRLMLSGGLGPLVTVSRIRFEGLRVTQPRLIEKSMGRLTGLPYSRATAEAAPARAMQLGLFRSVTLVGLEGEGDWSKGHLVYRIEEPRYNRFEGAVGVQGEAGAVGVVRLDLENLLGTGRAVGLNWESRGRGVVHLGGRYAEPLVLGAPLRLEAAFDQQVQDTLFVRTRWGARARLALSGQDALEAGYEQERVVQERDVVEQAQTQSTVFALEHTTLDAPLAPRRGARVRIGAGQSFKSEDLRPAGRRSARSSAADVRGEWHRLLTAGSGITLEIQSAGRFSSERVLPLFERYGLGGAASLRGYDEEAFRVDRYALARLEWRWFVGAGGQRVFVFWDHARAGTRVPLAGGGDRFDVMDRDGVGFGLRLEAAGGVVGLDYGLEPGRPPLEGKIHLQLVSEF